MPLNASRYRSGFLLREALSALLVLSFLAFLAIPGLHRLKSGRDATVCLNNLRQLGTAWIQYADDNDGRLVQNFHGGGTVASANDPRNAPWAAGWLDWTTSPNNTNLTYLRSEKYARFSPYITSDNNIHKCPSDRYISVIQAARGLRERVRSVAMNLTIGDGNAVTGPWDPGMYKQAKLISDLLYPSPAETFVFIEEHPDSINDPGVFPPRQNTFVDIPASFHSGAGNFTSGDGRAETHVWQGVLRRIPVRRGLLTLPQVRNTDPDLKWLNFHSQRISSRTY